MLEYASPLPLVTMTTSGAHSGTRSNTSTGVSQPAGVNADTAAEFLKRAKERARSQNIGAVFSVTFSDEPPDSPGQVMRLISLVQHTSSQIGLRYIGCAGWEFRFKKLVAIPEP